MSENLRALSLRARKCFEAPLDLIEMTTDIFEHHIDKIQDDLIGWGKYTTGKSVETYFVAEKNKQVYSNDFWHF